MKKILFGCAALLFMATSCKKDSTTNPVDEKYMSLTTDSRWIYDVTTNPGTAGSSTVQDTVTATNIDTSISGRAYRILLHNDGSKSYYYNSGSDYYQYQASGGVGGLDISVEELYLKDNASSGTNWSQTVPLNIPGSPLPLTLTILHTITDKGVSRTVNGTNYTDVIGVKTDLSVAGLPAGTITTNITSYYARRVGLIEGNYIVSIPMASIDINTKTVLKSADIR